MSAYQAMEQEMIQLSSALGTEAAFIEPEILKMDSATIERFLSKNPACMFTVFTCRISRVAAITRSAMPKRNFLPVHRSWQARPPPCLAFSLMRTFLIRR